MIGVIGMGDVKLSGLLAGALALLPPGRVPASLLLAACVACAVAGGGAIVSMRVSSRRTLPFGPALLTGFWVAVVQFAVIQSAVVQGA
ncbi:hypothetical protein [Subtercola frigoramans]|uniref:Prepilin signal peptidase PulO-like enzyme (Type II secretory pathway) n=1 Tax=Subtercola frigoramans TaxID=120298 RepID=A0ABS2L3K9_9MICO|nr:hypothetical protein [Subtercola frigoramans]MBM7471689.1 prepilin signal peptidase PulO-like enzyme (type II secretory pathway) [Subtercola frigoramans]